MKSMEEHSLGPTGDQHLHIQKLPLLPAAHPTLSISQPCATLLRHLFLPPGWDPSAGLTSPDSDSDSGTVSGSSDSSCSDCCSICPSHSMAAGVDLLWLQQQVNYLLKQAAAQKKEAAEQRKEAAEQKEKVAKLELWQDQVLFPFKPRCPAALDQAAVRVRNHALPHRSCCFPLAPGGSAAAPGRHVLPPRCAQHRQG